MLTLLLALACATEPPAPLPPPAAASAATPEIDVRRVKAPGVEGYLARPLSGLSEPRAALVLVETLDAEALEAARREAGGGVALAVAQGADPERATAYLLGIPGVQPPVRTVCAAPGCAQETSP